MKRKPLSPFHRRARQFVGRSSYSRPEAMRPLERAPLSVLSIAYRGVRRPCVCVGCIVLTAQERARQKRVFAMARAVTRAYGPARS